MKFPDYDDAITNPLPFEEVLKRLQPGYGFTEEELENLAWEHPGELEGDEPDDNESDDTDEEDLLDEDEPA